MYSPNNSPDPLPSSPILFTQSEVITLNSPEMPNKDKINLNELREFIGNHTTKDGQSFHLLLI